MLVGMDPPSALTRAHDLWGVAAGLLAAAADKTVTVIAHAMVATAIRVKKFIKGSWQQLLIYAFAWAVIVCCFGALYGFDIVALPLTIGLGCGLGFGMLIGVVTANAFDKQGKYTAWNGINYFLEKLDANGTRQLVLALAVTVVLAIATRFPYGGGAGIGIIAGNQLAVKIATEKNLGRDPNKKEDYKEKYLELKKEHENFGKKFQKFEYLVQNNDIIEIKLPSEDDNNTQN